LTVSSFGQGAQRLAGRTPDHNHPRYINVSGTIDVGIQARREDWSARGDRMARERSSTRSEISTPTGPSGVRLPWSRSDRPVPRRLIRPVQAFLETELASGFLMLAALVAALVWANAPFRPTYNDVWRTELAVRLGAWGIADSLGGWIREGLMSLFFLVVGLEIKREIRTGELRHRRALLLPLVTAIGGMVIPASIYLAVTFGDPGRSGWGAAMPTDLALALGVVAVAAPRCPPGLRVLLLSLAIADDLGTIVVAALFYSQHVELASVLLALVFLFSVFVAEHVGIRATAVYLVLGAGAWVALHGSGVSPTLAGVALGLLTPAVPFQRPRAVSEEAHRIADETVDEPVPPDADAAQWMTLASLSRQTVSPLARLEQFLHPWTSYVIVPLFVLANAGVSYSRPGLVSGHAGRVALAIVVARVIGKPLGIVGAALLAVRLGSARMPEGVTMRRLLGIGMAAGIPFSVSLFVGELAFGGSLLTDACRIGVIAAAIVAGLLAFPILRGASAVPVPAEGVRA
jgi:NhaA family Na+:H+ antiporter